MVVQDDQKSDQKSFWPIKKDKGCLRYICYLYVTVKNTTVRVTDSSALLNY